MLDLLQRLLPIFFLITLGVITKKNKLLNNEIVTGLKNIIINLALPVVLFNSFANMNLDVSFLLIFIIIFLYCTLLYIIGNKIHVWFPNIFKRKFTAGYFTGFEFGMIGIGLFGALWGIEKLPVIMLVGFGHELFIWFLYVPMISFKNNESINITQMLVKFFKTPTIIGIIIGILFNLLGIYEPFGKTLIGGSIYATIDFLIPLTSPLILLIIGFSMSIQKLDIKETIIYIVGRWLLVLSLGVPVLMIIIKIVPNLDPMFIQAFFAFILLPAPYILPLYIKNYEERMFFSQLLVYSTVTSFVGYIVLMWSSIS